MLIKHARSARILNGLKDDSCYELHEWRKTLEIDEIYAKKLKLKFM